MTVTTAHGTSAVSEADQFKYVTLGCQGERPPIVTSYGPSTGSAGTQVTIRGERFFAVVCGDIGRSVRRVTFGSREATFTRPSEGEIIATAPPGSGTVPIRVEAQGGVLPERLPPLFTYKSSVEKAEYNNWVISGSLTDNKMGQKIPLPEHSTFSGTGEVNAETGAGSVSGSISIPAFSPTLNLFGVLGMKLGLTLTPQGPLHGSIANSETVPGDEALTASTNLNVGITSVSMLGLTIHTNCTAWEPLALSLTDTLTREELLSKGWAFSGSTTLAPFRCEGTILGGLFGWVLTTLLSGPENAYSLSVKAPAA